MKYKSPPQWLYYLLAMPYFKPGILGVLAGTDLLEQAWDIWRLAAAAAVCVLYVLHMCRTRRPPSVIMILLAVYLGFVSVGTLVRENNLWQLCNHVLSIGSFCMLLELRLREDAFLAVDMLVAPLSVLVSVNFIMECLFPWGMAYGGTYGYDYNFLGIDNLIPPVLIPYMFLVALHSHMREGKLDLFAWVMLFISAESLLILWSTTGLMGLLVALVFLLFFYGRRFQTWFNYITAMLAGTGLFFGIVLFRLQNVFAFFIEGVLHKGLSFTGRTDIWDGALRLFLMSPWLGYGLSKNGKIYRMIKRKYYHAHNIFLELLVEGGIFGLLAYLFMLERAGKQLLLYRKHPIACILSAAWMAVMVMTSMEPFLDQNGLLIYGLILLSYYVEDLVQGDTTN